MSKYQIRRAMLADLPELIVLCQEHADHEKVEYFHQDKVDKLKMHIFGENPVCFCLVVEMASLLAGYASYTREFSTWDADFYIHMDCLFLRPHARNMGIGRQLIENIKTDARALGCHELQWQTPKFNTRAISFYKQIGAVEKEKVRFSITVT